MIHSERIFRFAVLLSALMLLATGNAYPITALLLVSVTLLVRRNQAELSALRPFGGLANYLTLIRGIALLLLLFLPGIQNTCWPGVAGLLIALADVADGWLARKFKCATLTGSLIDEQTDALYILVLGYLAYRTNRCGAYILVPGLMKYGKDLLTGELPHHFAAHARIPLSKWLAGIAFIVYATPFLLQPYCYRPACMVMTVLLCLSFAAELALRFRRTAEHQ